ncbi:nucleoside triphosphate pyrophosphohydrolase [Bosea sp. PAMC 26642]|uniref:nucleoside triphosphate pyrophosphohydrolase n=1 Tax=Bosea sp. (strain PAMC 26642) TaxID=1792307 RepID=UPI0007703EC1|nr:nucleoside triphosphate pyrophosphohydrolase [Bosea sp. PAMC 26642]AMJ60159.1 nucleoside triphosphate hydrolase [Bosea sp. PAMC 26642]
MKPSRDISRLIEIMAALRTPGSGCPWDLEQDFASIAPYTVEEAYEVADAIARGDRLDLKDELGDLLLQVVYHAQLAQEEGSFAFPDVVETVTTKMIRRHPHVFGEARDLSPLEVKALWHAIKAQEKADKATARAAAGLPEKTEDKGVLAGVPHTLPALTRAWKLQAKASTVGFDWKDARLVLDKIREETAEIDEAMSCSDKAAIKEEIGDLLFVVANLARHVDADPEGCLIAANAKFERRFGGIEQALEAQGRAAKDATLDEMEALWQAVKRAEKANGV